jgi:hypothetical protein
LAPQLLRFARNDGNRGAIGFPNSIVKQQAETQLRDLAAALREVDLEFPAF